MAIAREAEPVGSLTEVKEFGLDGANAAQDEEFRANASVKSHAELNDSTELDAGNPRELGAQYRELRKLLPRLTVMGGCCGTDHRHVEAICTACLAA